MQDHDKRRVAEILDAFYKGAGHWVWNGEVNEGVAKVTAVMLCEASKCSKGMDYVPRPPSGVPSVTWVVKQIGDIVVRRLASGTYKTCQVAVIYKLGRLINEAQVFGEAIGLPSCES